MTDPNAIRDWVKLVYGPAANEDGVFEHGQLVVWTKRTKRSTWNATIDDAVDTLVDVSRQGDEGYVLCALHDPRIALSEGRKKAERDKRDPDSVTLERVRGCRESATVLLGLWSDEDHGEGDHKKENLPPNLDAVLGYLREMPGGVVPSVTLDSGGGAYPWLLFEEPWVLEDDDERARAQTLVDRFQAYLRTKVSPEFENDVTSDLSRLLRAAGTVNQKYGKVVRAVDLETGQHVDVPTEVRRVNPSEIEDFLDMVGVEVPAPKARADRGPIEISDTLSPRVQGLLDTKTKLRNLFDGTGKPTQSLDGRKLDTSCSGYDFSLVFELAKAGVRDRDELATALRHRTDGHAASKGGAYIARTVDRALQRLESAEEVQETEAGTPFEVEKVLIYNSNPAQYELIVNGRSIRLTSAVLRSKSRFETVFMDTMHGLPALPKENDAYRQLVGSWLGRAEFVEMPPEASAEEALREAVETVVQGLNPVPDAEELSNRRAYAHPEHGMVFKVAAVMTALEKDGIRRRQGDVCRVLKVLGYESRSIRIGDQVVRAWSKSVTPVTREDV